MKNNSVIFKNPEDDHLIDLTYLGTMLKEDTTIQITQDNHFFIPGDVLAYNLESKKFIRALAVNTIQSEVCGVVSEYIDSNNFILVAKGIVNAPQYKFPNGSILYLSEVIPGKLMSIQPTNVFREIATQVSNGVIEVKLKVGLTTGISTQQPQETLEPYTKTELDEIIVNVM